MKIYILGIGGTFMSGIAQLAKEKGYEVHGCDQKLYHPMDKVLQRASIKVDEGYDERIFLQILIFLSSETSSPEVIL